VKDRKARGMLHTCARKTEPDFWTPTASRAAGLVGDKQAAARLTLPGASIRMSGGDVQCLRRSVRLSRVDRSPVTTSLSTAWKPSIGLAVEQLICEVKD
jgi:hypothetical protein